MIGAEPHEVCITAERFQKDFARVIYHLDEPTLGTGAFPQFCVADLVSRNVKVVLTGHGGDELFAGYVAYKAASLRDAPGSLLPWLAHVRGSEIPRLAYFLAGPLVWPELVHGLFIMFGARARGRIFGKALKKAVGGGYAPLDAVKKILSGRTFTHTEQMLYLYLKTYLPTLFIQEDKVGMAHSIEARTPLCDNEMVALALSVPADVKLHKGTLKYVPREAMKGILPDLLYRQPKRGFPTPFARWFRRQLRGMMEDLLLSPRTLARGVFSAEGVNKLVQDHLRDRSEGLWAYARANAIYSLMAVEMWFRVFIDGEKPA
jgi:asparagine synthase (glutamine-hydrolysing)